MAVAQVTISLSKDELEALVRRVVREELIHLVHASDGALPAGKHEGPDNPEEDAVLLREALSVLWKYGNQPEAWVRWEEFEAELERAKRAGEPGV